MLLNRKLIPVLATAALFAAATLVFAQGDGKGKGKGGDGKGKDGPE